MKRASGRIKLICTSAFAALTLVLLLDTEKVVHPVEAFAEGPPAGHTGAPGEQTCNNCHSGPMSGGTFSITPPQNYVPGQTYQIVVRHINPDPSRQRWGFQLTALASTTMAGTFANTTPLTQIVGGIGRDYIEHNGKGTFQGV